MLQPREAAELALNLDPENDDETMDELRAIMEEKGIRNAYAVLTGSAVRISKMISPFSGAST